MEDTVKKVGAWVKIVMWLSAFSKQIWKYLALIFAGVIAGLVYSMKQEKPVENHTNIEAENYYEKQDQHIGKLKQKGEGNTQSTDLTPEVSEKKEKRLKRREERKARKKKDTILN